MKKLLSKTRAAIDRYGMLGQNEKIAVGVSGGKDSTPRASDLPRSVWTHASGERLPTTAGLNRSVRSLTYRS